ncbi:serine/threonine protein kinase [Dactylosporangium sp. CA-233914]|uniref:serine/threonine protein kinase n=1 Tax=Dactylosporangium sp. CA-233914 TaxID=3239934 RepID=UPI003D92A35D
MLSDQGKSDVAIKILEIDADEDPQRWLRHAHLLKALDHPGIVRVIDVFTGPPRHRFGQLGTTLVDTEGDDGVPQPGPRRDRAATHRYVVMGLVDGEPLGDWLADQPNATTAQRIRSLRTVAAALDHMHSGAGTRVPVAHGDVKPANIIRRADGSTILVDLGLARLADDRGRGGHTRPYAAPELFERNAVVTPDSDRFAFVATVVHALLGQTPPTVDRFGPDLAAIEQLLRKASTTAHRPELVDQLMSALRCRPEERPRSLSLWLTTLTETLSSTTGALQPQPYDGGPAVSPAPPTDLVDIPPAPRSPVPRAAISVLTAVVVIAIATIVWWATKGDATADESKGLSPTPTGAATVAATPSLPTTSPTPSPSSSPGPSATTRSPTPGPSTPGPTPSGEVLGVLIAGPNANDSGVIVSRSENAVYGMGIDAENFSINGNHVQYGWVASCKLMCSPTEESYVELNLGRSYTKLQATFGISDKSSGKGPLTIQIAVLDNNQVKVIYKEQFTIGSGGPKTVNVTGVLRLKISFIGPLSSTRGALGDPTLF